jgi:2-dehydro-3-deoxygluconokinase
MSRPILCFGEALIDFHAEGAGPAGFPRAFVPFAGGAPANVAVAAARLGGEARFAGMLSNDPFGDFLLDSLERAGVGVVDVARTGEANTALAFVSLDARGERSFTYWRETAPARELFELPDWPGIAEAMLKARMIYFSGITLSIYSNAGLGRLFATLELARRNGVQVAFDSNFRPKGWNSDLGRTRTVYIEALKRVDIALPTYDDEAVLWGDPSPEATVDRLQAFGIGEIAVKNGRHSALVASDGARDFVPVGEVVEPLDSTAAGDSFNAAYLAARLMGGAAIAAAGAGHRLAAEKLRHRGAIMPRASSPMH